MQIRFWLVLAITSFSLNVLAQCLTDFEKLLPEPSPNFTLDYGRITAMHNDIMAVSVPNSDTTVRLGGIVLLYKKVQQKWFEIAMLEPTVPLEGLLFGYSIDITEDYVVVGAYGYGGKVYIFKKPTEGWSGSHNEIALLTQPNTTMFGAYYKPMSSLDLSEDQQTLVVADARYWDGQNSSALFVYHKTPDQEWNSEITPTKVFGPEPDIDDMGSLGVVIMGNRIIVKTPFAPSGNGAIYIFHDPSGTFSNFHWEAVLTPGNNYDEGMFWFDGFIVTPEGIFSPAAFAMEDGHREYGILFFEMPSSGWINDDSPQFFHSISGTQSGDWRVRLAYSNGAPDRFFLSFINKDRSGKIIKFSKDNSLNKWNSSPSSVLSLPPIPSYINHNFSNTLSTDGDDLVSGLTPLNGNTNAQYGLTAAFEISDNSWTFANIGKSESSTVGHYHGRSILGFEDFLFVSAPYDGTVKENAGVVYCYKKQNNQWTKTGKILPVVASQYDDVFGSALASNGEYLAVAALGFEPHGKVFIYKKTSSDWSTVQLVQTISPPASINSYGSGDHIAMDGNWLLIPALAESTDGDGRHFIVLSIYKFNGTKWTFFQNIEVGDVNFFARYSTVALDIEDGTIAAGGLLLQQNSAGLWEPKYQLYPSDKEPMRIAHDFSRWITNGDLFGHSVDIQGDNIFIGAPTKDDGDLWDVGAVYVFTRKPGKDWSSGPETAKLLPRIREESGLFGTSVKALNNTIIVGAPGSEYTELGQPRNLPGRAYVLQSKDYYWHDVTPLIDFTGDTFKKDYFGLVVTMDETDFIISSVIEDNMGDQFSGSVYITPTPPIVKLVPPVCNTEAVIDLFGYPFGGTWQGPGIIDASEGTFNPKIAGVGVHEFTYQTPSCTYEGKLKIEVKAPPPATLVGSPSKYVCTDGPASVELAVTKRTGAFYRWYYKDPAVDDAFSPIDGTANTFLANKTGEYKVRVYNDACEKYSPVITVQIEPNPIIIPNLPTICDPSVNTLSLIATPAGGTWNGSYVLNNDEFNASGLSNGNYTIHYNFTSINSCHFSKSTQVTINRLPALNYSRTGTSLCEAGTVELTVTPTQSNFTYEWTTSTESNLLSSTSKLLVHDNGIYSVKVGNGICSKTLPPYTLNDNFTLQVNPIDKETEICSLVPFCISTNGRPADNYNWFYSETESGSISPISDEKIKLKIDKEGYYQLNAQRGPCFYQSEIKHITIIKGDSLFVPNVITPNNDNKNDIFQVMTQQEFVDLLIINRYGQIIYEGDGIKGWDGSNVPTGVYFWHITFTDCSGARQTKKGFVHLIR